MLDFPGLVGCAACALGYFLPHEQDPEGRTYPEEEGDDDERR